MNVLRAVYLRDLFLSDSWQKSMESKIALTQRSAIFLCLHTKISLYKVQISKQWQSLFICHDFYLIIFTDLMDTMGMIWLGFLGQCAQLSQNINVPSKGSKTAYFSDKVRIIDLTLLSIPFTIWILGGIYPTTFCCVLLVSSGYTLTTFNNDNIYQLWHTSMGDLPLSSCILKSASLLINNFTPYKQDCLTATWRAVPLLVVSLMLMCLIDRRYYSILRFLLFAAI